MTYCTEETGEGKASNSGLQNGDFHGATPPSSFKECVLLLCGFRRRVEIDGISMEPTLSEGDVLLFNPAAYRAKAPTIGDLLLIKHPYEKGRHMVKRLTQIIKKREETRYHVEGDNPDHSTDSRSFGTLINTRILGQITSRYSQR